MELKVNRKALKIKSILGFLENLIFGTDNLGNDLLVLNYHGTPKKFISHFDAQMKYLSDNFCVVNPNYLNEYYSDRAIEKTAKRPLLITFDDGLKNNLNIIQTLEKFNIKALFFVVPDFIDSENQKEYYLKYIRPIVEVDVQLEDVTAMTWTDLKFIISKGHQIGSHSKTHTLKNEFSAAESKIEIEKSKEIITSKLELGNVQNFCAPNDSLFSTGKVQMQLIKRNHKYFHSTYPGSNFIDKNPYFIRRVNVESFWSLNSIKFAIGRFDKKRFTKQNLCFQEIAEIAKG